jgi:cell division protein FtsQ
MTSFEIWRRLQQRQTVRPRAKADLPGLARNLAFLLGFVLLAGGLLAGLGIGTYKLLTYSDFFQITGIKIDGCRRTAKEEILKLSGVDIHTNLLSLDLGEVGARIEAHGWIEQVRVERRWPNGLVITIRERSPVALINLADGLHHLDRNGVIFAKVHPPADLDYPVITGDAGFEKPAQREAVEAALRFLAAGSRGNPALPRQNISELYIAENGELTVFLVDRFFPIYLGRDEIVTKYSRLARVLNHLYRTGSFSQTSYIHLDYARDKVLVGTSRSG